MWARTTSDYSKAFTRIRDAVAALPVDSAVLDGEAIVLRTDNSFDFEALRSARVKQRRSWSPMTSCSKKELHDPSIAVGPRCCSPCLGPFARLRLMSSMRSLSR